MTFDAPSRACIAGAVWLAAGLLLIWRGLFPYWVEVAHESFADASLLLCGATLVGAAKGWFVLRRGAMRVLRHIEARPGRQTLAALYPRSYYPLLLVMVLLGFAVRAWLGETLPAIVAGIYRAVGAALLSSTVPYFRFWRSGASSVP
jgi:hypothetical protein